MNIPFRLFLVLSAWVALVGPAFSQGFTFDTPKGWTLSWSPDKKDARRAPDANFQSDADGVTASVSILKGKDASGLNSEQLKDIILAMAEDSLPKSREGKANMVTFGAGGDGLYVRLTDKDSQADFKYLTFAIHRKGKELALGLLTSNDDDRTMLRKFLGVVESVTYTAEAWAPTGAGNSQKNPGASTAPSAQGGDDEAWGAIATDANMGDNDPFYGIGGGDTQAQAEKEAVRNCREAGAKRCVVRVSYLQCGAFAVSTSGMGMGSGNGATKRAAEKQAVSACKGKGCEIVASDCN